MMPDPFPSIATGTTYEAIQVGEDILLLAAPLDQERRRQIERLANRSIAEHRQTLEGLAR